VIASLAALSTSVTFMTPPHGRMPGDKRSNPSSWGCGVREKG